MFAYLALVSHRDLMRRDLDARVDGAAETSLGWVKDLRERQWVSPSRRSRLWVWTNEPADVTAELVKTGAAAVLRIGTLDAETASLLHADDLPAAVAGHAGDYSVCRVKNDEIVALCTLSRQIPIYHVGTDEIVCVTNRALLAHLFERKGRPIEFDIEALAACAATGYVSGGFWTERTPFAGIGIAPANSLVRAVADGVTVRDVDSAHARFGRGDAAPDAAFFDDIAEMFLDGLRRFRLPPSIDVALTGGKDSRVLVTALANLDVAVQPGARSSPSGREEPTLAWDVRGNIGRELLVYDGMTFTVPRLPRTVSNRRNTVEATFSQSSTTLSTKGAEIWRGGYANRDFSWLPAESPADAIGARQMEKIVRNLWLRNADNLLPEVAARHEDYVRTWLREAGLEERPTAVAERFYLDFEVGRRDPPHRFLYEARGPTFQPFLQHEILRRIGELDIRHRRDDHIHDELVARFGQGAEGVPVERPLSGAVPTDRAWPLWGAVGSDYWTVFRDEIFGYDDGHNVWSLLSRSTMEDLFRSERIFDPFVSATFWVVYGLSLLMAGEWLEGPQPEQVIAARHRRPWPAIYASVVKTVRESRESARQDVASFLAEWADTTTFENLDAAGEHEEDAVEVLFEASRLPDAALYPGAARTMEVEPISGAHRVRVNAEPGSTPANSYIALPLGRIPDASRKSVAVSFAHRSTSTTTARMYLVRYAPERYEVNGPAIVYRPEWQTEQFTFVSAIPGNDGAPDSTFTLLLGLGDGTVGVLLAGLEVTARRRPSPLETLSAVRERILRMAAEVDEHVSRLSSEHRLSTRDVAGLRRRAGLDRRHVPEGSASLEELARWVLEEAQRARAAGSSDLGAHLLDEGVSRFPFLQPLSSAADDVLTSLLEASDTAGEGVVPA